MSIKRGIDAAATAVVDALQAQSKDLPDSKQIANVGKISANNDEEIGEKIAEAMEKVGKDGVITVEESKTAETFLETVEGMQFDRGIYHLILLPTPIIWKQKWMMLIF